MYLEDVGYTGELIEYISCAMGIGRKEAATAIGESGIARLCNSAGMNRHLPIHRIAHEVVADYNFAYKPLRRPFDAEYRSSDLYIEKISSATQNKNEFAHFLYLALIGELE